MKSYTITINERQAGIMQVALETYARLGMYQIDMALNALPQAMNVGIEYEDQKAIEKILRPYKEKRRAESLNRSEYHDVAWDLHTVIRHRMAWDKAKERGEVKDDGSRDWSKQLSVWYDEPRKNSLEPLAKIEVAE